MHLKSLFLNFLSPPQSMFNFVIPFFWLFLLCTGSSKCAEFQRHSALATGDMDYIWQHLLKYKSLLFAMNFGKWIISLAVIVDLNWFELINFDFYAVNSWTKWSVNCSQSSICPNHQKRVSSKVCLAAVHEIWIEKNYVSLSILIYFRKSAAQRSVWRLCLLKLWKVFNDDVSWKFLCEMPRK